MKRVAPLFLCLLFATAGCSGFASETPTSTHDANEQGRISISIETWEYNETAYFNSGALQYKKPATVDGETFHDVVLCLYDSEGNVLNSTVVGDFSGTHDSATYEISADERPEYLTVDHPRFYDYDLMRPVSHVWQDNGRYRQKHESLGDLQDDFPYPRHNETGRCL